MYMYVSHPQICQYVMYMYMCKSEPWVCCVALPCLFAFACFFLSSFPHLSLKHVYNVSRECIHVYESFLQICQRELGHNLSLDAYLIKPVQRILKYHLLLHVSCMYACLSGLWLGRLLHLSFLSTLLKS